MNKDTFTFDIALFFATFLSVPSRFQLIIGISKSFSTLSFVKGARSRNRKETCYLYNLYCCLHVAIVFCTDFGGWGESTRQLFPKLQQYPCNRTTYACFACFSTKLKSLSSKQHLHFEKNSRISVIWPIKNTANRHFERSFLHYVTQPL